MVTKRLAVVEPGSVCPPLYVSPGSPEDGPPLDLAPFVVGCAMLGIEPKPQQIRVARVVLSRLHSTIGVELPRRSGKTVGLWACALGLCVTRDDYQAWFTAQSGIKARERWLSVAELLDRRGELRGAEVRMASGRERFTWRNGSSLKVVPPKADAFRGEDSDLVWVDEAQEFGADDTADLMAGIAPTQDTRPGAMTWVSGTAPEGRVGLLWDTIQAGIAGSVGIVKYGAADDADRDDEATWYASHPGLAYGMTTVDVVRTRHATLDPDQFDREYLGRTPMVSGSKLIAPEAWSRLGTLTFPDKPDAGLVFALDTDTQQRFASIVAVWKAGERVAVEVVETRPGIDWCAKALYDLYRRHPGCVLAWDGMPANVAATQALDRVRPKVKVQVLGFRDMKDAAAAMLLAVESERLQHFHQAPLDAAADSAVARSVGDGWLFARSQSDVTALVGASVGLFVVDRAKVRQPMVVRSSSSRGA